LALCQPAAPILLLTGALLLVRKTRGRGTQLV
jgi:hypothetical protein